MKKKVLLVVLALVSLSAIVSTGFYTKPGVSEKPKQEDNSKALAIYEYYLGLAEQANQVAISSLIDTTSSVIPTDICSYCLSDDSVGSDCLCKTCVKLCYDCACLQQNTPMQADIEHPDAKQSQLAIQFLSEYIKAGGHDANYILHRTPHLDSISLVHLTLAAAACFDGITSQRSAKQLGKTLSTDNQSIETLRNTLVGFFEIRPSDYAAPYLSSHCEVSVPALFAFKKQLGKDPCPRLIDNENLSYTKNL